MQSVISEFHDYNLANSPEAPNKMTGYILLNRLT